MASPLSHDLRPGSAFAGYRIDRLIGRGGMGAVYEASDGARRLALKLVLPDRELDPSFRSRFERESRLAAEIDNPHVIPLLDAGEADGVPYLAMELVEGIDLEALLAVHGPLHPRHAADLVAQLSSALDAAHAVGLVHRDVKPGNVLLEARGDGFHAYLSDFGLAKHQASQSGLTRTGQWVGTVDYASPEQLQAAEVDARTDVYSLGCLLYEALTGSVAYPRDRDVDKLMAHLVDPPPRPTVLRPEAPADFDAVVARAMAKQPGERFQRAGELGEAACAAAAAAGPPEGPLLAGVSRPDSPADPNAPTAA